MPAKIQSPRFLLTLLWAALCSLSLLGSAHAHSKLLSTHPVDGAELAEAPHQLSLVFNRPLRLVLVTLTDATGTVVTFDLQTLPSTSGENFDLPMPEIKPGDWSVSWSALGSDGHAMRGGFAFTLLP